MARAPSPRPRRSASRRAERLRCCGFLRSGPPQTNERPDTSREVQETADKVQGPEIPPNQAGDEEAECGNEGQADEPTLLVRGAVLGSHGERFAQRAWRQVTSATAALVSSCAESGAHYLSNGARDSLASHTERAALISRVWAHPRFNTLAAPPRPPRCSGCARRTPRPRPAAARAAVRGIQDACTTRA